MSGASSSARWGLTQDLSDHPSDPRDPSDVQAQLAEIAELRAQLAKLPEVEARKEKEGGRRRVGRELCARGLDGRRDPAGGVVGLAWGGGRVSA